MALIKITDKHLNLGLKFEHPIALNHEKKYKLGVNRLMISFERKVEIKIFLFFTPNLILVTFILLNLTLEELIQLILYKESFRKYVMKHLPC
jgi:hypothetical protein